MNNTNGIVFTQQKKKWGYIFCLLIKIWQYNMHVCDANFRPFHIFPLNFSITDKISSINNNQQGWQRTVKHSLKNEY